MGMFDTINIDKKWLSKNLKKENSGWQTKDLECLLFQYNIDKKGKLILNKDNNSWIERPHNLPDYNKYSGIIEAYNIGNNNKFRTLNITFKEGFLIKIEEINELL